MNNQIQYERLRDLRERNHFTQAFVSSKLNIGRATYSNYERGKRTPSLDLIMDLAAFYKVPFTYFLNSENPELAASKEPPLLPLTPPPGTARGICRFPAKSALILSFFSYYNSFSLFCKSFLCYYIIDICSIFIFQILHL